MPRFVSPTAAVWMVVAACGGASVSDQQPFRSVRADTDVVENGERGSWTQAGILEEVLRIGRPDGAQPYLFSHIDPVAVTSTGSVYAYDRKFKEFRLFDSTGTFVQRFGRLGSGPGEFRDLMGAVATDSSVVGWDAVGRRMVWFRSDGTPLMDRALASAYAMFGERTLLADTLGMLYVRVKEGLMRIDRTGAPAGLVPFPGGEDSTPTGGMFLPRMRWNLFPDGRFAWGKSDAYSILVPAAHNRWLRITRSIAPDEIAQPEREDYDALSQWLTRTRPRSVGFKTPPPVPKTRPYFEGIERDVKGRIWVLRQVGSHRIELPESPPVPGQPRLPWANDFEYDVFGPDGAFLGRVPLKPSVKVKAIHGDDVWAAAKDDNGIEFIVRYRLVVR